MILYDPRDASKMSTRRSFIALFASLPLLLRGKAFTATPKPFGKLVAGQTVMHDAEHTRLRVYSPGCPKWGFKFRYEREVSEDNGKTWVAVSRGPTYSDGIYRLNIDDPSGPLARLG